MESSLNMLKNLVTSMETKNVEMKQTLEEKAKPATPSRTTSLPVDDLIDVDNLSTSSEDDIFPGAWLLPPSAKAVPNALKDIREKFQTINLSAEDKILRENALARLCLPTWALTNSFPEKEQQAYEERRRLSQSPRHGTRTVRRLSGHGKGDVPVHQAYQPTINSPLVPQNTSSISAVSARSGSVKSSRSDSVVGSQKDGNATDSPQHSTASFELNPGIEEAKISLGSLTPDKTRSRMARPVKRLSPLPSQAAAANKARAAAAAASASAPNIPATHTTTTTATLRAPSSRPSSRPQSRGVSPIRKSSRPASPSRRAPSRGVSPSRQPANPSPAMDNHQHSVAPRSGSQPRTIPQVGGGAQRSTTSSLPRRGGSGLPRPTSRLPAPSSRARSNFGFKPKPR